MDVDRLLLVSIMKTKFPIYFAKIELFSFQKSKAGYLLPFLSFLQIPKF